VEVMLPVPVGNLRSEILMVQSAQNRHRQRALVAERACRSAVAVTISALVLTADPAGSIAVSISVGVHACVHRPLAILRKVNKGRSRGERAYCSALRRAWGGIFE
jgi:hypothetical protein